MLYDALWWCFKMFDDAKMLLALGVWNHPSQRCFGLWKRQWVRPSRAVLLPPFRASSPSAARRPRTSCKVLQSHTAGVPRNPNRSEATDVCRFRRQVFVVLEFPFPFWGVHCWLFIKTWQLASQWTGGLEVPTSFFWLDVEGCWRGWMAGFCSVAECAEFFSQVSRVLKNEGTLFQHTLWWTNIAMENHHF